jgi:hypothetical protein
MLDRIERLAAAMKLRLARRVDEVEQWKRSGYASAAEFLATQAGSSVATAKDMLGASSRLRSLPVVEDALRAGKLSGSQAVAVTDAAAMAPTAQARLVNQAQRSSLAELRQECLRTKAAADRDREATRARIHRERYLRTFTDAERLATCTSADPSTRWRRSRLVCSRLSTTSSSRPELKTATKNARPTRSTRCCA